MAQHQHAFIWDSANGMQDIGTLGGNTSYAVGINDSGEVVGYAYLADNVTTHAFTWTASGGMIDLGALPGGSWTQGSAINSAGDIAGQGLDANGIAGAVLLVAQWWICELWQKTWETRETTALASMTPVT